MTTNKPIILEFKDEVLPFRQWLSIIKTDEFFTYLFKDEYTCKSVKHKKGLIYKYGKI